MDRNEDALYYLRKIIALRREEQNYIDALKQYGIVLLNSNTDVIVTSQGKEKLGLPVDEAGDCVYMGVLII